MLISRTSNYKVKFTYSNSPNCWSGIAKHLGLPAWQNKKPLVEAIFAHLDQRQNLTRVLEAESSSSSSGSFRKNKNTFARLANFLFEDPDALAISKLLSSRMDLRNREYNENNAIYASAVEKFNDWSIPSGGLVANHEVLDKRKIDPDERNLSGPMTKQYAFKYFKDVVELYAPALNNKNKSGFNNPDIWPYCRQNIDVLYLDLWLQKLDNPQLQRFCTEGAELPHFFDSGTPTTTTTRSEPTSSGKKRKDDLGEVINILKENVMHRKRKSEALEDNAESITELFNLMTNTADQIQKLNDRGDYDSPYHQNLVFIRDSVMMKIQRKVA
jgi:hypothetical protein